MQEILNDIYFDNSLKAYIVSLGIVFMAFVLRLFVAKYIAIIIYHFSKKFTEAIPRKTFVELLAKPLSLFIFYMISIMALYELKLPSFLDIHFYKLQFKDLLQIISVFVLVISFFNFLLKLIDFIVIVLQKKYTDNTAHNHHQLFFFVKDLLKVVLIFFAIVLISKYAFDYNVEGFLTGLGVMAAAIALALKENIENLFASFIIFFDKPFSVGDTVTVSNVTGTVEKIGLRSTRLRSDNKTYITIPNKQMSSGIVENTSNYTARKVSLKIQLKPNTSKEKIETLLAKLNEIFKQESLKDYAVTFSDITNTAIIISCDYSTYPTALTQHNIAKQKINLAVLSSIEALKLEIVGI